MVVMDGQIHSARAVSKRATQGVGAFHMQAEVLWAGSMIWCASACGGTEGRLQRLLLCRSPRSGQVVILHGCVQPSEALIPALLSAGVRACVHRDRGRAVVVSGTERAGAMAGTPAPDAPSQSLRDGTRAPL